MTAGCRLLLLLALLFLATGEAAAQDSLWRELEQCRSNQDSFQRLTCYDAVADRLRGTGGGQASGGGQSGGQSFNAGGASGNQSAIPKANNPLSIAEFSGNGQYLTRVFYAPGAWQLRWKSTGSRLQIFLSDDGGNFIAVIGNQSGAGAGVSDPQQAGVYTLNIATDGPWAMEALPNGQ